jgi:hypothetical protein
MEKLIVFPMLVRSLVPSFVTVPDNVTGADAEAEGLLVPPPVGVDLEHAAVAAIAKIAKATPYRDRPVLIGKPSLDAPSPL